MSKWIRKTTTTALRSCYKDNEILGELIKKIVNPEYIIDDDASKQLIAIGLLEENGEICKSVLAELEHCLSSSKFMAEIAVLPSSVASSLSGYESVEEPKSDDGSVSGDEPKSKDKLLSAEKLKSGDESLSENESLSEEEPKSGEESLSFVASLFKDESLSLVTVFGDVSKVLSEG